MEKDFYYEEKEKEVVQEEVKPNKLSIKTQFETKKGRMRFITRVSMFAALSTVFHLWLKFPLPFFPPFLKVSFSNLFIIIGSLLTGPVGGIIIPVVRFILKIILSLSSSGIVGDITDLIIGFSVSLPVSITYLLIHTKKGGIFGIFLSFISWIIVAMLTNLFISLPMYGLNNVLAMVKPFAENANEDNLVTIYLFYFVLPFNALVGFVNCGLALIVYKKTSSLLKTIGI